jgi:hypothetical protein
MAQKATLASGAFIGGCFLGGCYLLKSGVDTAINYLDTHEVEVEGSLFSRKHRARIVEKKITPRGSTTAPVDGRADRALTDRLAGFSSKGRSGRVRRAPTEGASGGNGGSNGGEG